MTDRHGTPVRPVQDARAVVMGRRAAGPGPGRRSGQEPEAEAGPVLWTTSNDQSWDPVAAGP